MTTEQDDAFARAVIRLKISDEQTVGECMKTVVDGDAPNLADAMIRRKLISRELADRVLRESGTADAPGAELPPEIEGYELLQKLGEGGMGTVWKARQTSLDRLVAIKILPPLFSQNRKFIERFRREALATAKLNHPNIVSAIDVGRVRREGRPDVHYFVMEFVDGESVEDLLAREQKIDPLRAIDIARDVARALDHAWKEAGIIHRDIKPANILIARNGEVKLADLGLARSVREDAKLTTAGLAIGTPHYASPEQATGRSDVDTRSDLYALGATLFEMLTGRTVFQGETGAEVMARHVNEDAPSCRDFNPQVPPGLAAVVAKMLRRDPAERYQTPAEALADLDRVRHGERPLACGRSVEPLDVRATSFGFKPPEVFNTRSVKAAKEQARRPPREWPHAVAAALFLAAVAFAVWYAVENRSAAPGGDGPGPGTKGAVPPAVPSYPNRVTLSFHLSNPEAVVATGGTFPPGVTARTRVRCYVRPRDAAFVRLVMVSNDGPGGAVRLRLLVSSSEAVPQPTHTMTPFPSGAEFYSLPASAGTVAFFAVAAPKQVDRGALAEGLRRIERDLSAAGRNALPRLPAGRTLWYDRDREAWPAGGAKETAEAAAVLNALTGKIRALFENGAAVFAGAAVSYTD